MKPKIDPSKKYTSGGRLVELLYRVPQGWPSIYVWHGVVDNCIRTWTEEGRHGKYECNPLLDLIEVREPLEIKRIVDAKGTLYSADLGVEWWDKNFPTSAPHTLRKFREVIE